MQTHNPDKEELVHVAGDMDSGIEATTDLTGMAHAKSSFRYEGRFGKYVLDCEIYGQPGTLMVHFICPKCHKALSIKQPNKSVDFDKDKGLFTESFECTWEIGRGTDNTAADRIAFGLGLCQFKGVFEGWRLRDA